MLVALDEQGKAINILEKPGLQGAFYCPACKSPLRLKRGTIKMPHFAHVSLEGCDSWSEHESAQHLELKLNLYQWFSQKEKVEIEKYLPEIQQTADLLVNDRLVIEVQCSSLSLQRLVERTENYRKAGYFVLWLQGRDLWLKNSLTSLQKNLLYYSEDYGFYFWELDLDNQKIRLKSLIHQDLQGRMIYLTEEFDLLRGDIIEILRLPFKAQKKLNIKVPKNEKTRFFIQKQLYHRTPKWLKIQEKYYQEGKNLLTEDWNKNYWSPPGLNLLTYSFEKDVKETFCQIETSLVDYYQNFYENFEAEGIEILHAPCFYAIIKGKNKKEDGERNGKKTR